MKLSWYKAGDAGDAPAEAAKIDGFSWERATAPEGYDADPDLAAAVNVALYLGQPLLVTGEPGTGKTQLAYSVAWQLGLGEPLEFATKSTSVAKDLFYRYDAIGHFGAKEKPVVNFVETTALGEAILRSRVRAELPEDFQPLVSPGEPTRSVVLVDEIDKAPRDFPNDLLREIEAMRFRIPELSGEWVAADRELRPIVILTSNSEKHLPAAFLRRCVYFHIGFPKPKRLRQILSKRLGNVATDNDELVKSALDLFMRFREKSAGLDKPPSTFELLGWLRVLVEDEADDPLADQAAITRNLPALIKSHEDKDAALRVVEKWLSPTG